MYKLSSHESTKVCGTHWAFNKYLLSLKCKWENKKAKLLSYETMIPRSL